VIKMAGVIDMQLMRYINLFSKVSNVSTTNCFIYNNQITYCVPESKVSQAIGKDAVNVRRLNEILRKKIKVIAMPQNENRDEIAKFIGKIIEPVEFNKIEVKDNAVVITAGRMSKAALIGRNRMREKELAEVLKNYFHILKLKIA
jgi:NusA-like KH domain protein